MGPQIAYIVVCVAFAYANKMEIIKNKRILHGINGGLHIIICGWCAYYYSWQAGVSMVFIGRVFFDTALNVFRGLGVAYVTLTPRAITDKIEQFFFKRNWWLPKLIYILLVIALTLWNIFSHML